jgi:hypothetical protein
MTYLPSPKKLSFRRGGMGEVIQYPAFGKLLDFVFLKIQAEQVVAPVYLDSKMIFLSSGVKLQLVK